MPRAEKFDPAPQTSRIEIGNWFKPLDTFLADPIVGLEPDTSTQLFAVNTYIIELAGSANEGTLAGQVDFRAD